MKEIAVRKPAKIPELAGRTRKIDVNGQTWTSTCPPVKECGTCKGGPCIFDRKEAAMPKKAKPSGNTFDSMSYEEIRDELKKFPMTWYPDLLMTMIESAYEKKVFVIGGASEFVAKVEKRIGKAKL